LFPHLFERGDFIIHTYHVALGFTAIGIILGGYFLTERMGVSKDVYINFSLITFIGGVIGWRIVFLISKIGKIIEEPSSIQGFIMWGNSFPGIMLIGGITSLFYLSKKTDNLWRFYDEFAPVVLFGYAFMKIFGCFLTGCCFGLPTDLPWGVKFPENSIAGYVFPGQKLHPVQLYEGFGGIILGLIAIFMNRFKRYYGETSLWIPLLLSVQRFSMDFFRWRKLAVGNLSLTQFVCIIIFFVWTPILISFYLKKTHARFYKE